MEAAQYITQFTPEGPAFITETTKTCSMHYLQGFNSEHVPCINASMHHARSKINTSNPAHHVTRPRTATVQHHPHTHQTI
jgi:hypothetical protein